MDSGILIFLSEQKKGLCHQFFLQAQIGQLHSCLLPPRLQEASTCQMWPFWFTVQEKMSGNRHKNLSGEEILPLYFDIKPFLCSYGD